LKREISKFNPAYEKSPYAGFFCLIIDLNPINSNIKSMLSQKRRLIADFNANNFKKPRFESAVLLFEKQVKKTPKNVAVEFGRERLTYEELNQRVNIMAAFLVRLSDKNQQKIYVLADKGIDIIVAFLGILKSGNILIPINPRHPSETIRATFKEIKPDLIIVQQKYLNLFKKMDKNLTGIKLLNLDRVGQFAKTAPAEKNPVIKGNKYAYIYFTSGSTGHPKAVVGTNINLSFRAEYSLKDKKHLKRNFRIGQISSIYMHLSLGKEILPALCCGATVCIPSDKDILSNIPLLTKWLEDNHIALVDFPGDIFKYFMGGIKKAGRLKDLKHVFVSGVKLDNDKYLKKFFEKFGSRVKLSNFYGATEAPLGFEHEISRNDLKEKVMPIGKTAGAKAIVLNEKREVLLPGQMGEIYIRSPYLTAGYYNNPVLTKKVFIQNPLSRNSQDVVYYTGDMGRLLPDGNIEFLGRGDNQVKIRGFRVELREIEVKLLAHAGIKNCAVLAKKNENGENYLVAYYVAAGHPEPKNYLRTVLPDYMIPSFFIRLERFPLTPSGKIDRLALPEPELAGISRHKAYRLPATKLEGQLAEIWQRALGLKRVSVNDNFFELGGSSLNLIAVNNRLAEQFNTAIPFTAIFQNPTIRELAVFLKNQSKKKTLRKVSIIKKTEERKYYLASRVQKDFWWLSKTRQDPTFLNLPVIIKFSGFLNVKMLQRALREIVKRQEILRTNFLEINGEVFQVIKKEIRPIIKLVNLSKNGGFSTAVGQIRLGKAMRKEIYRPFDLENGSLIRPMLIKTGQRGGLFILVVHNIVFDSTSCQILIDELAELCDSYLKKNQSRLLPLPVQFKNYADWAQQNENNKRLQEGYWLKKLKGKLPLPLRLRTSASHQAGFTDNVEMLTIKDKEILGKIKTICQQVGATTFMFVLALLNAFLFKITGEKDLIIGSNATLRNSARLNRIIGPFFNNLALRNKLSPWQNFMDVLKTAKKTTMEALANREYSFSEFLGNKRTFKDTDRPILNVFLEQPQPVRGSQIGKVELGIVKDAFEKISFDLKLAVRESSSDKLSIRFVCNDRLFSQREMKKISQNFNSILGQIVRSPYAKISDLKIIK
jgi:amino acid adenylation domain-containing protein